MNGSAKEKTADKEKKGEKRGSALRADAQWVVLLTVLSAVVTVLAYLGVQGPTLVHILTVPAASSPTSSYRPSPAPTPGATQPPFTLPASTLPLVSSAPPATPSPTQDPSSPAVTPSDFDNVQTDPTEVSVATMLPLQFNDSGVIFNRTSTSVDSCPPVSVNATAGVNQTVQNYGCTSEVVGTYLGTYEQVQVSVWVIPLPDAAESAGAYNTLKSGAVSDWGIWCPDTGTGSQVCGEPWRDADQGAWTGWCHRYIVRASAIYLDLAPYSSSLQPTLDSAAASAASAIGPQNISIAACWPSTAGS
ncbi:MAG TPA: hypothetical protein VIZ43_04235 [Trebonia sp.]